MEGQWEVAGRNRGDKSGAASMLRCAVLDREAFKSFQSPGPNKQAASDAVLGEPPSLLGQRTRAGPFVGVQSATCAGTFTFKGANFVGTFRWSNTVVAAAFALIDVCREDEPW